MVQEPEFRVVLIKIDTNRSHRAAVCVDFQGFQSCSVPTKRLSLWLLFRNVFLLLLLSSLAASPTKKVFVDAQQLTSNKPPLSNTYASLPGSVRVQARFNYDAPARVLPPSPVIESSTPTIVPSALSPTVVPSATPPATEPTLTLETL